jgi:hypothetical protein
VRHSSFSRALLFRSALGGCCAFGAAHLDDTVTAVGAAFCYDGTTGTRTPLAGARVMLMDSDCDGSTICDDVMGQDVVKDDGRFSVTGRGGDPVAPPWSRPDVYVRVVYNDDHGVRLTDELNADRYFDTPEHEHDNVAAGSTIDVGAWSTGEGVKGPSNGAPGEGTQCGVWRAAHAAYEEYQQVVGSPPPVGAYDVEYWSAIFAGTPWTNDNTTHWPIHYPTTASRHEFAHAVRHTLDGDRNHFNWDVTRFRYARYHDRCDPNANRVSTDTRAVGLAFGFNEGWAEFWEDEVSWCGGVANDELEGNVAHGLSVLASVPGVAKRGLVEVLRDHPGQIHSLDELTGFLASKRATTRALLQQRISAARSKASRQPNPAWIMRHPQFSDDDQTAAVAAEARLLRAAIRREESLLVAARAAAARPPVCRPPYCDDAIRVATRPAFIRLNVMLERFALDRLRSAIQPAHRERMRRALVEGTIDRLRDSIRSMEYARTGRALLDAYAEAIRVGDAAVASRNVRGAEPVVRELREEQARLAALVAEGRPLPTGALPIAMLSDGVPQRIEAPRIR